MWEVPTYQTPLLEIILAKFKGVHPSISYFTNASFSKKPISYVGSYLDETPCPSLQSLHNSSFCMFTIHI
jgi:hypothetical protein